MKVLITGGTGSLGQELVRVFSQNKNYDITFTYYNNASRANVLADKYGCKAVCQKGDYTLQSDFDIIINNAGIVNSSEYFENVDLDKWTETLNVNLTLPFALIKQNLPHMKANKFGRIINISSIYGLRAEEGLTPYCASKHALIGLTRTAAREYGAFGITCNAICPGVMDSELTNRVADIYTSTLEERTAYFKTITDAVANKALVKPCEVAELAYFVSSDRVPNMNGAILVLDGGDIL